MRSLLLLIRKEILGTVQEATISGQSFLDKNSIQNGFHDSEKSLTGYTVHQDGGARPRDTCHNLFDERN